VTGLTANPATHFEAVGGLFTEWNDDHLNAEVLGGRKTVSMATEILKNRRMIACRTRQAKAACLVSGRRKVRVKHGFRDVDYPVMPLGGWAETVTEV
jgi:hypothetical protein